MIVSFLVQASRLVLKHLESQEIYFVMWPLKSGIEFHTPISYHNLCDVRCKIDILPVRIYQKMFP